MIKFVKISETDNAYFVAYVNRKKFSPKFAAQFSKNIKTLEQVKDWIETQPNLKLHIDVDQRQIHG